MTTYQHHENGRRDLKASTAKVYAAFLKVPAGSLLYGETLRAAQPVPIVGSVSATGKIEALTGQFGLSTSVTPPDTDFLVAVTVSGNDLYPVYRDGDTVYFRELSSSRFHIEQLHGLECVVDLENGDRVIRVLMSQGNGLVTLIAYSGVAPLLNQRIRAAAPIELVQRKLPAVASNH